MLLHHLSAVLFYNHQFLKSNGFFSRLFILNNKIQGVDHFQLNIFGIFWGASLDAEL